MSFFGPEQVIDRVIEAAGTDRLIARLKKVLGKLTPEQKRAKGTPLLTDRIGRRSLPSPALAALPDLLGQCANGRRNLYPSLVERLLTVAKSRKKGPPLNIDAVIRLVGLKRIIEEGGL